MNIRIMTISSAFAAAWAVLAAMAAADERGAAFNPLCSPDRTVAAEDVPPPFPPQPPPATGETPRSPPSFWRNPGWLRFSAPSTEPGTVRTPDATAPSATPPAAGAVPAPPAASRTLIQRIRDRRLAQLEKQAERLRQLSAAEDRQPLSGRGNSNPNGPENPDLQIDLGAPVAAPGEPTAAPAPPEAPAASLLSSPDWPPGPRAPPTATPPPELNPPAEPPLEVNIDLPSDIAPPQPKPTLQGRARTWWSTPR